MRSGKPICAAPRLPSVAFASVDLTDDGLSGFTAVWLAGAEKDQVQSIEKNNTGRRVISLKDHKGLRIWLVTRAACRYRCHVTHVPSWQPREAGSDVVVVVVQLWGYFQWRRMSASLSSCCGAI